MQTVKVLLQGLEEPFEAGPVGILGEAVDQLPAAAVFEERLRDVALDQRRGSGDVLRVVSLQNRRLSQNGSEEPQSQNTRWPSCDSTFETPEPSSVRERHRVSHRRFRDTLDVSDSGEPPTPVLVSVPRHVRQAWGGLHSHTPAPGEDPFWTAGHGAGAS